MRIDDDVTAIVMARQMKLAHTIDGDPLNIVERVETVIKGADKNGVDV